MNDLSICFDAWDAQPAGYVFICSKKGSEWRDFPFSYPDQAKEIKAKVDELCKQKADTYWSIWTFDHPKRREDFVQKSPVLYSDLDAVDPETLKDLKPSVAWRSSTTRFQGLWFLKEPLSPSEHKNLNRNLSYYIGADKGGWDLTQVLRIPGSFNYKYAPAQEGAVLWKKPLRLPKDKFEKLPTPETGDSGPDLGNFVALLSKYRKKIPPKISHMLQYPEARIEVGHRSEVLWSIEQELVAAKIPMEDIVALIAGSAWNKYRGRADEMKRITTEIEKIYVGNTKPDPVEEIEAEDVQSLPIKDFTTFMGGITSQPGWMVKDIWLRRSHGIIAGDPKTFKSTVAMDIAVSVASGKPLWGKYAVEDQGPVLMIQNENSDWIVKDRMEKIMASKGLLGSVEEKGNKLAIEFAPNLPIAFLNNYGFNFSDPLHIELLESYLADIKPTLVIFDPLYLMFDGEMNSAKELNPVLQWLLDLKNRYNTSVMLIHHWNKNGMAARGGQRMLGSVALHGWTESGLFLQSKEAKTVDPINMMPIIVAGPKPVGAGAFGQLMLEREFRAAGILPKLQLEIHSSDEGYSCSVSGNAVESSLAEQIFRLILDQGPSSLYNIAQQLNTSRDRVSKIVERDPSFVTVGQGKTMKVTLAT